MIAAGKRAILRPQAILFDWDNTLVDSWATIHEALNICMAAMGKPAWTIDETRSRVRLSLRESFPQHFGERWEEARDAYLDAFRAIHLDRLTPLPGCAELLESLGSAGIHLGVVSNKTGAVLRREAEQIGWARLFGGIVGAGDAAADKPDPAPVRLALRASGLTPGERVWFVGDTGVDMMCARNSGCLAVLLGGDAAAEEFRDCAPDFRFSDPADLFHFIRDL
jgi:phosphoglycolate phosphatase